MPFSVWTVKAMFCILLTSSYLAVKVGVQKLSQRAEWKNKHRQRGRWKTFLPLKMEDLYEPAEPSVSAHFSHHYQKERKRERWERGGEGGNRGWKQRVVRITKVRHF